MNSLKYILNEQGEPVVMGNLMEWAKFVENASKLRRVAYDMIGGVEISTVFLYLDHNYDDAGPPILWETMVFGGPLDRKQDRCAGSREQALAMHARMVDQVKSHAQT